MAGIEQIIDELETIASAQAGLYSFMYADLQEVNTHRDKEYPLLLVERQVQLTQVNLKNRQRVYGINLHFLKPYERREEVLTPAQRKQEDLELLGELFLQEFRRRHKDLNHPWKIENEETLTGAWSFNKYNDRLVQLTYHLKLRCQGKCIAGNFSY